MKRSELEIAGYKKRIEDLNIKIQLAQTKKKEIIEYVKRLTLLHSQARINNNEYNNELYRYLKGNSCDEWINYYDSYINECDKERLKYKDKIRSYRVKQDITKKTIDTISSPYLIIFVLLALSFGFFLFTGITPFEPTGLVVGNITFNQTTDQYLIGNNLSDVNITITLKRDDHIPQESNVTIRVIDEQETILNI